MKQYMRTTLTIALGPHETFLAEDHRGRVLRVDTVDVSKFADDGALKVLYRGNFARKYDGKFSPMRSWAQVPAYSLPMDLKTIVRYHFGIGSIPPATY